MVDRLSFRSVSRSLLLVLLGMASLARPASAQVGSDRFSSIVVDAATGNILSAVAPDEPRYPASLTKIMTIYMLFEALRDRRVSLDQQLPVSDHAASMSPSKLGLRPGSFVTVEQGLLGLVTKSANDAAAALGELLGGDEDRFADMMTLRARALGMTHTTFRNASGLPDWDQMSTARDLAVLSRHVVQDFPMYYRYFSVPSFVFRGRTVMNHDSMLQTYPGADGLKTGWIEASGHNLVTSALRGNTRLIGVVLGAGSNGERDNQMSAALDQGFDRLGAPAPVYAALRVPSFIGTAQAAPVQVASASLRPALVRQVAPPARAPAARVASPRSIRPSHAPGLVAPPPHVPSLRQAAAPAHAVTRGAYYRPAAG